MHILKSVALEVQSRRLSDIRISFVEDSILGNFRSHVLEGAKAFFENETLAVFVEALATYVNRIPSSELTGFFFEVFCISDVLLKVERKKNLPLNIEKSAFVVQMVTNNKFQKAKIVRELLEILELIFSIALQKSTIPNVSLDYSALKNKLALAALKNFVKPEKVKGFASREEFNIMAGKLIHLFAFFLHAIIRTTKRVSENFEEASCDFELLAMRFLLKKDSVLEANMKLVNAQTIRSAEIFMNCKKNLDCSGLLEAISSDSSSSQIQLEKNFKELMATLDANFKEGIMPIYKLVNFLLLFTYQMFRKTGLSKIDFSWEYEVIQSLVECMPKELLELIIFLDQAGCLKGHQRFAFFRESIMRLQEASSPRRINLTSFFRKSDGKSFHTIPIN